LLAALAGCAGSPASVPVPTFPDVEVAAGVPAAGGNDAGIPDDCERVLPVGELVALLGLPLGSVAVRTTIGVPEPSVGRVQRVACRYTGTAGRVRGDRLLELNVGRYVDDASASRQWRVNAAAEKGPRRPVPLGTAEAVVVERPAEALLIVVNREVVLSLTLPAGAPRPPGPSGPDLLIDLALRVLAAVPAGPAPGRGPGVAG